MDPLFERVGCRHFGQVIDVGETDRLRAIVNRDGRPGIRLTESALAPVIDLIRHDGSVGKIASALLGRPAFGVRAIMFDKHADANWSLGWHQDRTIAVSEKKETSGFGPWTTKEGQAHVQPPQSVLEAMVTLRVHLDEVPADNAPLRVLAGSHRLGRLQEDGIDEIVPQSEIVECLAVSGDIWAYRTTIIHASAASGSPIGSRRVLQIDYADRALPAPLRWAMSI
ncbi:phytanoyl-CoA dioxygenase family protein [Sphingomonas sp.]|uniref:phytanoyl-CoA dioxygenase family protein n=1 Tax=Sphingomonas sp. TaxID=28214 RepID=UPI00286BD4F3|nr:phytanoyl-CoA dioxygenase family protein [Sphingomonas sp.]